MKKEMDKATSDMKKKANKDLSDARDFYDKLFKISRKVRKTQFLELKNEMKKSTKQLQESLKSQLERVKNQMVSQDSHDQ